MGEDPGSISFGVQGVGAEGEGVRIWKSKEETLYSIHLGHLKAFKNI